MPENDNFSNQGRSKLGKKEVNYGNPCNYLLTFNNLLILKVSNRNYDFGGSNLQGNILGSGGQPEVSHGRKITNQSNKNHGYNIIG